MAMPTQASETGTIVIQGWRSDRAKAAWVLIAETLLLNHVEVLVHDDPNGPGTMTIMCGHELPEDVKDLWNQLLSEE